MSPWLSPRAYIIGMTGQQTRELHRGMAAQAQRRYEEYVAELERKSS